MSDTSNDVVFRRSMRGVSPEGQPFNAHTTSISAEDHAGMPIASPSASILLISPTNRILLLHRVQHSTSFASAHVFPGGHLSPQDGFVPPIDDVRRHQDSAAYRIAAIRECFEESGLLLANAKDASDQLVELSEQERNNGRKAVHSQEVSFQDWVKEKGGLIDTEGLIPFTRWLTPANIPKRYSTQMYLYFLPIHSPLSSKTESSQMHIPTPDGGVEHTAAQFLYPQEWIHLALSGDIVLFPPQFFLLALIEPFLTQTKLTEDMSSMESLREQREQLMRFVKEDGDPHWGEKCISPNPIKKTGQDLFMGLEDSGPELKGTSRRGDRMRLIRIRLAKDQERHRQRPEPQEVVWREDILGAEKGRM
ncbi:hypothetical protein ACLMJK_008578 [Lecanora helva]